MDYSERIRGIWEDIADYFKCSSDNIEDKMTFSDGRSGDIVKLISVSHTVPVTSSGEYILKISIKSSEEEFNQEIANGYDAKQHFIDSGIHIPKLFHFSDRLQYYVYEVAREGNNEIKSFKDLIDKKKSMLFESFVSNALRTVPFQTCADSVHAMLHAWLGEKRLGDQSRFPERIRTLIGDHLAPGWLPNGDISLPNPYYFYVTEQLKTSFSVVLKSSQHGDLNQSNILISPKTKGQEFYLIDFSHYKSNSYLFFDQVYLLMDIILDFPCLLNEWIGKIETFFDDVKNNKKRTSTDEIDVFLTSFQKGIKRFFALNKNNVPTLFDQFLSACVAVGMNYMHKSHISINKQLLSFTFSSLALKILLEHSKIAVFDDTAACQPLVNSNNRHVASVWKIADSFNEPTRFILLTSCNPDVLDRDSFSALKQIPWCAVIDVNPCTDSEMKDIVFRQFKQQYGYQYIYLPSDDFSFDVKDDPAWISIIIDSSIPNPKIYYRKHIHDKFSACMGGLLSKLDAYPLCILIDSDNLREENIDSILTDIICVAGDNTHISIINLSSTPTKFSEEPNIAIYDIPCSLQEIARGVQISFRRSPINDILLPTKDGRTVPLEPIIAHEMSNHMTIIHRMILRNEKDDDGEAFYRGNEATWHDIANGKDAPRVDYSKWRDDIKNCLASLHHSSTAVIWLYHKPGGGGSTMAKRIMWDFCASNPTIHLFKINKETVNYLQKLYTYSSNTPLLVIIELNNSQFSLATINDLRIQLGRSGVRTLFIFVSRAANHLNKYERAFYLPDTPDMNMGYEESVAFLRRYKKHLDPVSDADRIEELEALTYVDTYDKELRQPFFYGLFAYEERYLKIDEYVRTNLEQSDIALKELLMILSVNTKFTQGVNLELREVAHFLFPDSVPDQKLLGYARELMSKNCFIIHRKDKYRISHPIIADKLLDILLNDGNRDYQLIQFVKKYIDKLAALYKDPESCRLNFILQGLFIEREPITDEERSPFSPLISQFQNFKDRIDIMRYLRDRFQTNPHYSNHLARLYLKPPNNAVRPDLNLAKEFALEAISRAEKNPAESPAIHHHLLGKIYSRKCLFEFKRVMGKSGITALGMDSVNKPYQRAVKQFEICSGLGHYDYSLVGRLELIVSLLEIISEHNHSSIYNLLSKRGIEHTHLSNMVAEAGNIIHEFVRKYDYPSQAFLTAQGKFYKSTGRISNLKGIVDNLSLPNNQKANYRRAIASILEYSSHGVSHSVNYDYLSVESLRYIKKLMESNMNDSSTFNDYDGFRWLEAYIRLPEFDLNRAYEFVMEWHDANKKLDVVYYRYVFAFMLYWKYQSVDLDVVNAHLHACRELAHASYGKNTTKSRHMFGKQGDDQSDSNLVLFSSHYNVAVNHNEHTSAQKHHREEKCECFHGHFSEIDDSIMKIRFSHNNLIDRMFLALAPRNESTNLFANEHVKFHLGFSYSGFRAWDITPAEYSDECQ